MEKSNTKNAVIITTLVMLVLGLGGYIVYDKFITKDTNTNKNDLIESSANLEKKEVMKEYISMDSEESLKLYSDNTYEITSIHDNENVNNNGVYTKSDYGYIFDNSIKIIDKEDFVIIDTTNEKDIQMFATILFNKNVISEVKDKIKENTKKALEENYENMRKKNTKLAKVENVELREIYRCIKDVKYNEEMDGTFECNFTYDIFFNEYNKNECESDSEKYLDYLIPQPGCGENSIGKAAFVTINYDNSYTVASCCGSGP